MYLSELKIWNFRKYGTKDGKSITNKNAGLIIPLQKGLNLLVGENDSGKTTIIDAIKYVLNTQTYDNIRLDEKDFHLPNNGKRTSELKIECIFREIEPDEAANFLEWAGFEEYNGENKFILKVRLNAFRKEDGRIITDVKAGSDEEGIQLDGKARNLLRVTYLKPLRDADQELSSGNRSRLAHILRSYPIFRLKKDANGNPNEHELEKILKAANSKMEDYFTDSEGSEILENINEKNFTKFLSKRKLEIEKLIAKINVTGKELSDILKSLNLRIDDNKPGLGSQNLLFIATELILLDKNEGLKLSLIEEIEAHLHAQAQIRLIEFLQRKSNQQFILTTHSPNLASKVSIENLIICKDSNVFPIKDCTELEKEDISFLERFLDVTKANLFFAEGVLIVEGDAENILLPTIAELIGKPLHEWGVSIVNVGSKALLRYAKIFKRKDKRKMKFPVACITDLDIKQVVINNSIKSAKNKIVAEEHKKILKLESEKYNIRVFSSPCWTLEYDIALGDLREVLFEAIFTAQLIQSRMRNQNFQGLSDEEISERREDARVKLGKIIEKYGDNNKRIAFEIYKPLDTNKASKTVTAQYLSAFMKAEKSKYSEMLKLDAQIKYLIEAIEYVTKPIL